jgi:hypothetical protein
MWPGPGAPARVQTFESGTRSRPIHCHCSCDWAYHGMTKLEPYTGLAGEQVGPPGNGRPHMDKVEIRKRQRVWRRSRSSILFLSVATVACLTAGPAHGEPPDRSTDEADATA